MRRLGILLSGRGSNFQAIVEAIDAGKLDAEIAVVISNRADAPGIEIARQRNLDAVVLPSRNLDREVYDRQVVEKLREKGTELVILAGYMRILSGFMLQAFPLYRRPVPEPRPAERSGRNRAPHRRNARCSRKT